MLALVLAALLGSAAMAYAIGAAVIAPRDSFLRTKTGIWILVVGGLSLLFLPPQLTALGGTMGSVTSGMFTWPSGLGKGLYIGIWMVTSVLGLLVGMRIWNVRKPDWRSGVSNAFDSSVS